MRETADINIDDTLKKDPNFPFSNVQEKTAVEFANDAKLSLGMAERFFRELREVHKSPISVSNYDDVDEKLSQLGQEVNFFFLLSSFFFLLSIFFQIQTN